MVKTFTKHCSNLVYYVHIKRLKTLYIFFSAKLHMRRPQEINQSVQIFIHRTNMRSANLFYYSYNNYDVCFDEPQNFVHCP